MPLKIYNTLTRKKEEFIPLKTGEVKMYACGVTVYDDCHIGHARGAIVFDVIRCYLEKIGYKVTYVRNFTDVDDKIISRANKDCRKPEDIAKKYIQEYYNDMDALGVRRADVEPKATEHIEEMISLVSDLVRKGYAYESNDGVYFEVRKFGPYGRLSGRSLDELQAGARVEINEQKKDPLDFALWKKSKLAEPNEPSWDSPWGKGRPGWHIECSAMARKYLGETLDIHAGGQDLIFPHHENEIAQSEASSGKPFARYWMHNGFVNINKEKMSKSLGNFFTVKDVLKRYDSETIRFFLVSTHYRSPIDFSDRELDSAGNSVKRVYTTLKSINDVLSKGVRNESGGKEFLLRIKECEEKFGEGMEDDFNTSEAVAAIFELVRGTNIYIEGNPARDCLVLAVDKIREMGNVLGLFQREIKEDVSEFVEAKIKERENARQNKDFALSDKIRDELKNMGIVLEDKKDGTRWRKI